MTKQFDLGKEETWLCQECREFNYKQLNQSSSYLEALEDMIIEESLSHEAPPQDPTRESMELEIGDRRKQRTDEKEKERRDEKKKGRWKHSGKKEPKDHSQ
jgi:hypothetical protein